MAGGSIRDVDIDHQGIHFGILLCVLALISLAIEALTHFLEHVSTEISREDGWLLSFRNRILHDLFSFPLPLFVHLIRNWKNGHTYCLHYIKLIKVRNNLLISSYSFFYKRALSSKRRALFSQASFN